MAKKSRFLKTLGIIIGVQVRVASKMLAVGYEGAKYLVKKVPKAAKKGAEAARTASKKSKKTPAEYIKLGSKKDISIFENKLLTSSMIITIAGKRGSGKSTLGFRMLENIKAKKNRPCFVIGVKQEVLPSWIKSIEDIENIKNKGVILVDEGAVSFSARESMKKANKELGKLMAIARHKDLTLILITQNTGMIDKNVLNLTDSVILKQGSLMQEKMERSAMKEMYKEANKALGKIPTRERLKYSYVIDDDFKGLMKSTVPSFWNEKVSKNKA